MYEWYTIAVNVTTKQASVQFTQCLYIAGLLLSLRSSAERCALPPSINHVAEVFCRDCVWLALRLQKRVIKIPEGCEYVNLLPMNA